MSESPPPIYPTIGGIIYNHDGVPIVGYVGPAFFGYCLDVILYGFLTAQVYLYYLAFPNDKKITKAIVCSVYVIGSIQTAFALRDFFTLVCRHHRGIFHDPSLADSPALQKFGFTWLTVPISSILVAVAVQLFYARRIYIISKMRIVTFIVSILALAQLGCGIYTSLGMYDMVKFPDTSFINDGLADRINAVVWGFTGVFCDLVIAVFMFVYISKQMKRTSKVTQRSLVKIKQLLLETGLLTAVAAMAFLSFSTFGPGAAFMIPGLALGKLYSNSMLAVLNNRIVIEKGRYATRPAEFSFYESDVAT